MSVAFLPKPGTGCLFGSRPVPDVGQRVPPEVDFTATVLAREALLGRKLSLVNTFRDWDASTYTLDVEALCIAGGRIPLIAWPSAKTQPADAATGMASGAYDSIIHSFGSAVRALNGPAIIRFSWEMNQDLVFGPAPSLYVAAAKRVYSIIRGSQAKYAALSPAASVGRLNAKNALFVFNPGHRPRLFGGVDHRWAEYDPGVAYKNLNGFDVYNKNPVNQSLATLLTTGDYHDTSIAGNNWYQQFSADGLPMMLCEFASHERDDPALYPSAVQTQTKAGWMTDGLAALKALFPNIVAVATWDSAAPGGDYRIDTDENTWMGTATLDNPITSTDSSFTAARPAGGWEGYVGGSNIQVKIGSERLIVLRTDTSFSIVARGWYGTTPAAHSAGALVQPHGTTPSGPSAVACIAFANDPYMLPQAPQAVPSQPTRSQLRVAAYKDEIQ